MSTKIWLLTELNMQMHTDKDTAYKDKAEAEEIYNRLIQPYKDNADYEFEQTEIKGEKIARIHKTSGENWQRFLWVFELKTIEFYNNDENTIYPKISKR